MWFESIPLAKALDDICADESGVSFSDEKAKLDQLESEVLGEGKEFLREVRRRVAERILSSAISRGLPLHQCARYLHRTVRLGFTDVIQEALIRISFCRYLISINERARASAMLKTLKRRCAGVRGRNATGIAEIKGIIDTLLQSLNH